MKHVLFFGFDGLTIINLGIRKNETFVMLDRNV